MSKLPINIDELEARRGLTGAQAVELLAKLSAWNWRHFTRADADRIAATCSSTICCSPSKPGMPAGAPGGTSTASASAMRRPVTRTRALSQATTTCAAKLPAYMFTIIQAVVSSSRRIIFLLSRKPSSFGESAPERKP